MARFDKIAKTYDSFLVQFYYFWAHQKALKFLENYFESGWRILDLACGTGNFLKKLKNLKKNFELFGADESGKMTEVARKKLKSAELVQEKAENLSFENDYFDLIASIDAFYYFKDKEKAVFQCHRTLKENGYFFLFSPSIDSFLPRFLLGLTKVFSFEKESKHLFFNEIKTLAEKAGFKLIKKKLKLWHWLILFQK